MANSLDKIKAEHENEPIHKHDHDHNHSLFGCEQSIDELKFENSLYNACVQGDIERVKLLIRKKGDFIVNEQDKNGYTALHFSSRNGYLDICKLLLSFGAHTDTKTFSCKSTPLHRAAYMGHYDIVQLLLDYKSNPTEKDCDGKTALHKCVERIKELKIDLNVNDRYRKTLKILLDFCPNLIEQIDNKKMTPLDYYPNLIEFKKN